MNTNANDTVSAELIRKVSEAHDVSASAIVRRVHSIRAVLESGTPGKTFVTEMKRAAELDGSIRPISAAVFSWGKTTCDMVAALGLSWDDVKSAAGKELLSLGYNVVRMPGMGRATIAAVKSAATGDTISDAEQIISRAIAALKGMAENGNAERRERVRAEAEAAPAEQTELVNAAPAEPAEAAEPTMKDDVPNVIAIVGQYATRLAQGTAHPTADDVRRLGKTARALLGELERYIRSNAEVSAELDAMAEATA